MRILVLVFPPRSEEKTNRQGLSPSSRYATTSRHAIQLPLVRIFLFSLVFPVFFVTIIAREAKGLFLHESWHAGVVRMTKTAIADQFAILNHCLSSWYLLSSYNMFALSYTMSSLCLFHAGLLFPINSPRDKQIFA